MTHLFFADDSLMFFKATAEEAKPIKDCLEKYERASGHVVNFQKSSISFSRNTTSMERDLVSAIFNVSQAQDFGKYLGLPSSIGRNKNKVFGYIEQKIRQRIRNWQKRLLSMAGKEILLKGIAQAMPTYAMSIFLLPNSLCERVERMMNRYWWGNRGTNGGGLRWMAWDRLCKPKKCGGMGFKKLHKFNLALLGKQGWSFLNKPTSLVSKIFKVRYFPKCSFLEATIRTNPSYAWRSILAAQDLLKAGIARRIGNGKDTAVWGSPWLPDKVNPYVETAMPSQLADAKVHNLMNLEVGWDTDLLNDLFCSRDVELILNTPISPGAQDEWYWRDDIRGVYSVHNAYRRLRGETSETHNFGNWSKLWNSRLPSKLKNFLRRCVRQVLPVKALLIQRGVEIDATCPHCGTSDETDAHALRDCHKIRRIWTQSTCSDLLIENTSLAQWIDAILNCTNTDKQGRVMCLLWTIWQARNCTVWEGKKLDDRHVIYMASALHVEWMSVTNQRGPTGAQDNNEVVVPQGYVLCKVDAACPSNRDPPGFGAVILDTQGRFVAARSGQLRCTRDPYSLEVLACREALSWLKARGDVDIILETDCANACHSLSSNRSDFSYAGVFIGQCRDIMCSLGLIMVRHVRRSANSIAHALARAASSHAGLGTWESSPTFCIQHLLMS